MPRTWVLGRACLVDLMPEPTSQVFTTTWSGDLGAMFYLLLKHSTGRASSYPVKAVKVEVPSG